jgi:hypothetical protein
VADWVTISAIASAGGTLVLAAATFASVKSANRAARAAERSLLAGLRPLLLPSKLDDPEQKVGFADDRWLKVPGGQAAVEVSPQAIYMAIALRNVGTGIALLHGWHFYPERHRSDATRAPLDEFVRLTRDLYVPAGDVGFWQGAFRDPAAPEFGEAARVLAARQPVMVDILYGDHEGGQRMVSRFSLVPRPQDQGWIATVGRHWNIDREDPR